MTHKISVLIVDRSGSHRCFYLNSSIQFSGTLSQMKYMLPCLHVLSFQTQRCSNLGMYTNCMQSSVPLALFGSPGDQFEYVTSLPVPIHEKVPSSDRSLPPIQNQHDCSLNLSVLLMKLTKFSLSARDSIVTSCIPIEWQNSTALNQLA